MAKGKKENLNSKKGKTGEKLALILAGIILVPTIALTTCIVLAQTTDMNFDWLATKAEAIEAKADAKEEAKIAEEEAAAAAKEQAAAEKAASSSSSSSSSSTETNVNVALVDNTVAVPTPDEELTAEVSPDMTADLTADQIDVQNDVTGESSAETSVSGKLDDTVYITDDSEYYHKNASCSGMVNPRQVTLQDALYAGKTPCSTCCK